MAAPQTKRTLTPSQRTTLSNSTNLAILIFLLQRPATLAEIAQAHQLMPLEANLRLRRLMEEGLVSTSVREEPGGQDQRIFVAEADDFELHAQASSDGTANAHHLQLILNQLKRDLVYHALHPEEAKIHVRSIGIRIPPERFAEWVDRLRALEQEFDATDDPEVSTWHFMTVAMYAQPKRDQKPE